MARRSAARRCASWLLALACLLGAGVSPLQAQIAFDAGTYGGATFSASSQTTAHTTSGANRYLVVGVMGDDVVGNTITGATYNSVAMSLLTAGQFHNRWLYVFGLPAPALGTHDVVVTGSTTAFIQTFVASYTGVKQTGQPDVVQVGDNSGAELTLTLTTLTDQSWLVMMFVSSSGIGSTANFTERVHDDDFNTNRLGDRGPLSPPGSYGMSVTSFGTNEAVLIALAPAVSAAPRLMLLGVEE